MKTIFLIQVFTFLLVITGFSQEKMKVDVGKSMLAWVGAKVAGEHNGLVGIKSGELTMAGNKMKSGKIVIDMSSITNLDIADKEMAAKLVGHLKSADFFNVEKYPTAAIDIIESGSFEKGSADVKANITIKGISQPVVFKATRQQADNGYKYFASIVIDRSKFDVRFGSGSFFDNLGDKVIYDNFTIKVNMLVVSSDLTKKE